MSARRRCYWCRETFPAGTLRLHVIGGTGRLLCAGCVRLTNEVKALIKKADRPSDRGELAS